MKKKTVIKISVVLLAILVICTLLSHTIYNMMLPQVEYAILESKYVVRDATVTGKLKRDNTIVISALDAWKIEEVFVKGGDTVHEGDPLFKIDTAQVNLQKRELDLEIAEAQKNVKQTYGKDAKAMAQLQLDKLVLQRDDLQHNYPMDGMIYAEKMGTLSALTRKAGDVLDTGEEIVTLYPNDGALMVEFTLPADQGGNYPTGSTVQVKLDTLDTGENKVIRESDTSVVSSCRLRGDLNLWEFEAELGKISGQPIMEQGVEVKVINTGIMQDFVAPAQSLRPGLQSNDYRIFLLQQRPGLFGTEYYVRQLEVEKIVENNYEAAIRGEGLLLGSAVVTSTTRPLSNGTIVGIPAGFSSEIDGGEGDE